MEEESAPEDIKEIQRDRDRGMKRRDLIRELTDAGCYLKKHGKRHDLFVNPKNGRKAPVPRHNHLVLLHPS